MRDFPTNKNHCDFLEKMNETLEENNDSCSRSDLAKQIEKKIDLKQSTMKTWLSVHREEIENHDDYKFESFEKPDGTSGYPTIYWRIEK